MITLGTLAFSAPSCTTVTYRLILAVYLQGNNFLSQSGTVILIFVIHIYGSNLGSTSGIMNVLKFLFVFIILVSVKYTVTKLNKQQFIQNLEK